MRTSAARVVSHELDTPSSVHEHVTDWSGTNAIGQKIDLLEIDNEEDLARLMKSTRFPIRVHGSKLSPVRLLQPDQGGQRMLSLSGPQGLIAATSDTITFGAATPLADVHATLKAAGRALPASPGVIARQSLAGALATGMHGQGISQSSLADAATSFRAVLADGSIQEFHEDDPCFGAMQLSLGSLGIFTQVTLRTRAAETYTCLKRSVSGKTLKENYLDWIRSYRHCKAWWFPGEDCAHIWLGREATRDEAARYKQGDGGAVELTAASASMNDVVDKAIGHLRNDLHDHKEAGVQFKTLKRFQNFKDVTGDVYQLFCNGIAAPQVNVEIALPIEKFVPAIQKLQSWHRSNRSHMHYPVIMRCSGPSTAWLSPAYDQTVCYFGFVVYQADDGSITEDGCRFLQEVQRLLAEEGGRPHWGKHFDKSLFNWPELYPRWNEFTSLRRKLDPKRRLANRFLESVGF